MTQRSFHWNAASLGDADALTVNAADGIGFRLANVDYESPFVDRGLRMLFNGDENRGVLSNWLNELAVAGVATPVTVATGGAVVYGMPYENTAVVNVAVPAPTTDTRQDRIVLRRDWAAQTIRITRIAGVEGGSVPAMTQSPAPAGTGIYDIPLATLSTTTGGVITVTDAREYCVYNTAIGDDALATAHLQNNSVDFNDRATRTCRLFLGGGDLEPFLSADFFYFDTGITDRFAASGTAAWDGAANEEGWELTGSIYEGVIGAIHVPPPNWAYGDITSYIWWVENAGVASTFYLRSAGQLYGIDRIGSGGYDYYYPLGSASNVYISGTLVANQVYRTAGISIPASKWSGIGTDYENQLEVLKYLAIWYNSAGVESINILGVEFQYTGYV